MAPNLTAEMEKYLRVLEDTRFGRFPRKARSWWAGGEIFSPEMHLAFNAAPYIFIGKYIQGLKNIPGRILDLGCGTGYDTSYLKEKFVPAAAVIGTDRVLPLIKYAAKNYTQPGLNFLNGDSCRLPFQRESFNMVIAVFSIVHNMFRPQARNCLAEISRILEPGGTLIFTSPNREQFQDLYHKNPNDDPDLKFCGLLRHEYYREELRSFLLSFSGGKKHPFSSVSIGSLTNNTFQPIWEEAIATMRRKRFTARGWEAMLSTLARRFLPPGLKMRHFSGMIRRTRLSLKISLGDIAKAAEYHPEEKDIRAAHFLIIAKKGGHDA